jgi:hypothetical protein
MAASHLAVVECYASLLLSSARHRIARAIAPEGDLGAADSAADDPKSATAGRRSLCTSPARRREWLALDRMSPSFPPNIAAAEDFVPAGTGRLFGRNGTMLHCRERDRVFFVATTARLSA